MNLICVIAPLLCVGIGFMISNFFLYFWNIEAVVEVHRWGFAAVAVIVTIISLHYLLANRKLAERMAQTRYEKRREEITAREKKLNIKQYNLNELYNRHRVYQNRIEQEYHSKKELNIELKKKLIELENLIEDFKKVNTSAPTGVTKDGRSNRQRKKIDKIMQNAESIKNGGLQ